MVANDPVTAYARAVVAGDVAAGKLVRLAAERHLRDMEIGAERGLRFDPGKAQRVIDFFGLLRLPDGEAAGQPFLLQPWQSFIVGSLFGWLRADGRRRFRYALVECARAQGKSPMAAGIALYGLMADGEQGAQIFSAATTRDQAKIVFNDGCRMAERSPGVMDRLLKTVNNLAFEKAGSFFRPLSADAATMDGLRVHFALVDELHEHPNSHVMEKLRTGMKSSQPLLFAITTAGYDRNSVCWQEHDHAVKVLEGTIESDAYFAYVATLDPDDDWRDEATWPKANPNLGVTVKLETLREECELAKQIPGQQNSFKRLRLNVWTESATRWIDGALWDAQEERSGPDDLAGRPCFAGLDLSTTSDITALVLYFPRAEGGGDVLPFFWVPEENMQKRAERDRVPYPLWAEQGFIRPTPGNFVDQDFIRRDINELAGKYNIREIAIDRWNAAQLTTQLMGDGFTIVPFGQGFASMSAPTKEMERLLLAHQVRHGGDPVLAWMASNAAAEQDAAGNQKISKAKSTERVDGIVALIMAIARASVSEGDGSSVYETRGLLIV